MAGVGLVFGLGWAHERLRQRGLGELALGWLCSDLSGVSFSIEETTSLVFAEGTQSDLRRVLEVLVDRIGNGPATLAQHKILPGSDLDGILLRNRYGNVSYGIAAAPRYGYATCHAGDVRGWLGQIGAETCTVFAGDFEPGELPFGSVRPPAEPSRDQIVKAGYLVSSSGIGLSWLHERNRTAEIAARIMVTAIDGSLPAPSPGRPGLEGRFRPIGADTLHVGVVAADPEIAPEFATAIVRQLDRLRTDGPDEVEILTAMDVVAKRNELNSFDTALGTARRELWRRAGYPVPTEDERPTDPDVLTDEIRRQGATLQLICAAPPTSELLPPSVSTQVVDPAGGREFKVARALREVGVPMTHKVVVADDRLTHFAPDGRTLMVSSVEVVERRPDGERVLLDRSGMVVQVDPLAWSRGDQLVGWVDQHLPDQIARDDRLPVNPYVARAALRARPGVLLVVDGLLVLIGVLMLLGATGDADDRVFLIVTGLLMLAAVGASVPLLRYTRRLTRRVTG